MTTQTATSSEPTTLTDDPFALFAQWMADARVSEPNDPEAMALSTVDAQGRPSTRMVLLKGYGPEGFTFYTNFESRKAGELLAHPEAALLFHWKSLRRQIRIEGPVGPVDAATADAYFASRPRVSQIGAWASDQSRPLDARETFEDRIREIEARFAGVDVPRPPHWSGFRLAPRAIEFWLDRAFRLHERRRYEADNVGRWAAQMLYP
ncbi:pyridoxamine 5'-phosphate oxidase [Sphingobium sp. B12D2B]|uniref:pyridoxamine 5'-phosphate oxidase n=1 Tax=Sphingobium sp. B12D2B TaxID=2940577 RepID=UPI0022259DAB|nr:pyridoxamine 5'-phosphate oxidase [Sphingobium sp. B12D2B]MCW2348644.1 pyridoxamine 5'-phosphate oxidase [Sphingobium sp. B12D2B]